MNSEDKNKEKNFGKFVLNNKFSFLLNFFIISTITFSILYMFGLVPEEFKMTFGRYVSKEYDVGNKKGELPLSIKIPSVGIDSQIYNPESTDIQILDSFLLKGVVRYPGSGLLGGVGNVFLFAHSTGIKIVNNQAFKSFNGLKKLKEGDSISVFSDKNEYIYKVLSVKLEGADKALVTFDTTDSKLTLSTCNTFGAKSERYVVESRLDEIISL
ncbi:MAG: sortase [Candidatus Paceibacterota bacterium]|jgi:LPXTG-site transpeptidase (sortase) family protein